jgi:hypothetical protein
MSKNVIELDEVHIAAIKKRLRQLKVKANNQDAVNYATFMAAKALYTMPVAELEKLEKKGNN